MSTKLKVSVLVIAVLSLSLVIAPTSHAALMAVGPVDSATGLPAFYQDATGLSLAPCFDNNGFCAITMVAQPGFDPALPLAIPLNFPGEGFYFFANASFADPIMIYIAALEFSFANGIVRAGDQVTFARIKIRDGNVLAGTITVTHPFGVDTITADPVTGINFTEDIGPAAGVFTGALAGRIGPYLKRAAGLTTAPDGNVYIGDSITAVPVAGTPVTTVTIAGAVAATANTFILEGKVIGMSVTPSTIAFPAQRPAPFASVPVPVTVTNLNAASPLTIASIISQGANAADFVVDPASPCLTPPTSTIAPAGSCIFNVVFSGAAAGPATRTASILVSGALDTVPKAVVAPVNGTIDAASPVILTTFPANGQTVPINSTIAAVFSEPMATVTVNNTTFTVAGVGGTVPGTVTFDSVNFTATFIPAVAFALNQTFTATITTAMTDLAGNGLTANKVFSFSTVPPDLTPPTIVSVSPPNNAVGVPTNATITVTFNEPMLSTSITGSVIQVSSGGVPVDGTVTVNGSIATFTPTRPLAFGAAFTVTITTGALDMANNALAAGQVINFVTNFAPTTPVLFSPADGATGLSTAVTLTWVKATDADGDAISYKVFVCNNPAFIGCSAVVVTASTSRVKAVYFAGLGGFGVVVFGLVSISGTKGRKRFIWALVVASLTGMLIYSCGGSGGGGSESDTALPTVPTGVTATAVSASQIDVAWAASSDNVGVTGYTVYRGGIFLTSTVTGTSISVTGLSPSTNYCYTVNAHDAAGNESAQSDPACATTQSGAVAPSNVLSFKVAGLNPGVHYFWKVAADDGKGGISESAVWSFTTQ